MAEGYSRSSSTTSKSEETDINAWKVFDILLRDHSGKARLDRVKHLFPQDWTESKMKSRLEDDPGHRFTVLVDRMGRVTFISVHCRAKLCLNYGQGNCTRSNCNYFHLCRNYLGGHCRNGVLCRQSHSFQEESNKNLVKRVRLAKYSEHELRCIIRRSILQVCSLYNKNDCKYGDSCSNLHVCEGYVMNECTMTGCGLDHSLDSEHSKRLLKCFRLDKMFERGDLNMLKKSLMTKKERKKQSGQVRRGNTFESKREERKHSPVNSDVETTEEVSTIDAHDDGDVWIPLKSRYSSDKTDGKKEEVTTERCLDTRYRRFQTSETFEGAEKGPHKAARVISSKGEKSTRSRDDSSFEGASRQERVSDHSEDAGGYVLFTPSKGKPGHDLKERYPVEKHKRKESPRRDHRNGSREILHQGITPMHQRKEVSNPKDRLYPNYQIGRERPDYTSRTMDNKDSDFVQHDSYGQDYFTHTTHLYDEKIGRGFDYGSREDRPTSRDFVPRPASVERPHQRAQKIEPIKTEVLSKDSGSQFICEQYLVKGNCDIVGCKYFHADRPFAWFACVFGEWHQFEEDEEVKLENAKRKETGCLVKVRCNKRTVYFLILYNIDFGI